jgi:hypothetical protein
VLYWTFDKILAAGHPQLLECKGLPRGGCLRQDFVKANFASDMQIILAFEQNIHQATTPQ